MGEVWTRWEGQVVNGAYPLRRFLNASDHSAVFLTESSIEGFLNAAIKLLPAEAGVPTDVQLWQWKTAATITHPHLMRLLDSGQWEVDGRRLLFVVMEYAEETLAQVLPYRALGSDEVRELLVPTLDALAFLHRENWIQGQMKPTNFLVVNDQLKLAIDTLRPVGVARERVAHASSYDPPEAERGETSAAADIWGLGVTLVEALTQCPPTWPDGRSEPAVLPPNLPSSFADTIQRCLSIDPVDRPSVADLQLQTRPASAMQHATTGSTTAVAATSTGATGAGIATPASTASSIAASGAGAMGAMGAMGATSSGAMATPGLTTSGAAISSPATMGARAMGVAGATPPGTTGPAAVRDRPEAALVATRPPSEEVVRAGDSFTRSSSYSSYSQESEGDKRRLIAPAIAAGVVILVAIWGGTRLFRSEPEVPVPPPVSRAAPNASVDPNESDTSPPATATSTAPSPPAATHPPSGASHSPAATPSPSITTSNPSKRPPPPSVPSPADRQAPRAAANGSANVVHEEVPTVSSSARQTIRGHVRVAVRVTVDQSGKVVRDRFENASSSKYFNRVASEAARKWKFTAADNEGPREWLLHFEFGRDGTTVHATRSRS